MQRFLHFFSHFYRQSPQRFIVGVVSSDDEDELEDDTAICLQDLVAMETMEQVRDHDNDHDVISDCIEEDEDSEVEDEEDDDIQNVVMETDDQVFTLASYKSSTLPIEPSFVNAILSPKTVSFGEFFVNTKKQDF